MGASLADTTSVLACAKHYLGDGGTQGGKDQGDAVCDEATLQQLQREERVVFRYCTAAGAVNDAGNPNGSLDNIAGICNEGRNVLGMMPHPERASESVMGGTDGLRIFESLVNAFAAR